MHRHTQPRNPRRRETATGWSCKQQVWQDWQTANEPPSITQTHAHLCPHSLQCVRLLHHLLGIGPPTFSCGELCAYLCVCVRECSGQLGFLGLRLRLVSASLLRGRQRSRGIMVCVCVSDGGIKWASQAAVSMCAAQLGVSSSGRRSEKSKWQGLYSLW